MKKLAALASTAVLLCASASFAKKALDEEEMDLVTAAGQPSVMIVDVEQEGPRSLQSTTSQTTTVEMAVDGTNSNQPGPVALQSVGDIVNVGGELNGALDAGLEIGLGPFDAEGNLSAGLNIDVSLADIETVSQAVASGATASLSISATSSASSTITAGTVAMNAKHEDMSDPDLAVDEESQTALRALALNNVAGENQLANGINVQANAFTGSGSQSNSITQSWGSTYDWTYAPGFAEATAAAAEGGDGGTVHADGAKFNCILAEAGCGSASANGGDASAVAAIAAFDNTPLTITSDKITKVSVESQGDTMVDVSEVDHSSPAVSIATEAQSDLAALAVNNVAGRNQVASAINITNAGPVSIGDQAGNARISFAVQGVGGFPSSSASQSNTINQFRGTPFQP